MHLSLSPSGERVAERSEVGRGAVRNLDARVTPPLPCPLPASWEREK